MNDFDQPPQASLDDTDAGLVAAPVPVLPPPDPYAALPLDLRVPWNGADLGLFLIIYLGINFILGLVVFGGAAVVLHKSLTALQNDPVLFPAVAVVTQVLISAATIIYFWVLVRIRRSKSSIQPPEGFWRTMGFRQLGPAGTTSSRILLCLLGGVGLSIIISIFSGLAGKQPPTPIDNLFQSRTAIILLMGFGILVAPLVEEMMFRGFLYPVVARSFGVVAGVLFTGILFGSFHALQLWGAWPLVALLMGVGIVFTWVRARTHSVSASLLMHIAYNSTLFVALLVQTKGLKDLSHIR
jgi:hypothetical protein